jgi:hypothetical protein
VVIESPLDLAGAIIILAGSIVPAYLSLKLKGNIAKLTIALTIFAVVHGIYHFVRMQGLEFASGVLEAASVVALISFGVSYLGISYKKKERVRQEHGG